MTEKGNGRRKTKEETSSDKVTEQTESTEITGTVTKMDIIEKRISALEENDIESRLSTLEQRIAAGDTKYPSNTRDYTVKEGDTLALIAKRELGNAGNLNQIVIMNYDRYPSFRRGIVVEEGWVLRLPPR